MEEKWDFCSILETMRDHFHMRHLDLSQSKEQVFNRKNNDIVIETHLICLVGRLLDIGIYPERFNNLTKGENNVLNRLIDDPTIKINKSDNGSAVAISHKDDYL